MSKRRRRVGTHPMTFIQQLLTKTSSNKTMMIVINTINRSISYRQTYANKNKLNNSKKVPNKNSLVSLRTPASPETHSKLDPQQSKPMCQFCPIWEWAIKWNGKWWTMWVLVHRVSRNRRQQVIIREGLFRMFKRTFKRIRQNSAY